MFGARIVTCLLLGVAMVPRVCHSQSCLDAPSGRTYNMVLVSERAVSCMGQATGVDLVASSKCECAHLTEEQDLNTFRYSEDGCRAFQAVPGAGGGDEEEETVEVYVAAEPTGDTALPPDNGPTVTGLNYNMVSTEELVAEWAGVGDYTCRAVGGYRVEFSSLFGVNSDVTTDLSATVLGNFIPVCGDYMITVTAQDENGNDFGTPATALAELLPAYKLECCSPPFVMSVVGCVFPALCERNFTEARRLCQEYGADLFTSANVEETNVFARLVGELLPEMPYAMVAVQKSGDDYVWFESGRLVDAAEWSTGGWPRIRDLYDCGYIASGSDGGVCNMLCSNQFSFFCSAPNVNVCESRVF